MKKLAKLALTCVVLATVIAFAILYGVIPSLSASQNNDNGLVTTTSTVSTPSYSVHPPVFVLIQGDGGYGEQSYFNPEIVVVVLGVNATITWSNDDSITHTVTDPGHFDSGNMPPAASWSLTFNATGTYQYACKIHPWMGGEVIVRANNESS